MATYNLTAGNDVLTGTADADTFDGIVNGVTGGTDTLDGGGGNDNFIIGDNSLGTINGGDGVDTIVLQSSDPDFPSTPSLSAITNTEILDLRAENARFTASQLSAFSAITNTSNPDAQLWFGLIGSGGTIDFSSRVLGNQSVWVEVLNAVGVSGAFNIIGTSNADILFGSKFNDTLSGGSGDDLIGGGFGGADTLVGGAGNDRFYIQSGSGTVDGGTGVDTVLGSDLGSVAFTNVEILEVDFPVKVSVSQLSSFTTLVNTMPDSEFLQLKLTGTAGTIDFSSKETGGSGVSTGGASWTIIGTANADELWGGSQSQRLEGGAGNDSILGGGGVDTLIGGAGDDKFIFNYLSYPVKASGTVDGGAGTDTVELKDDTLGSVAFTGVENLLIHDHAWIRATTAQLSSFTSITKLNLQPGEKFFFQLTGSGGGTIDLSTSVTGGHGVNITGENVSGIYNVVGTASADSLLGNSAANELNGGGSGDTINGGDGIDTASYAKSASGVTVNLATNIHSGGDAKGDSLVGIENVIGSNFADVLTGNVSNNRLTGGLGNDVYYVDNAGDSIVEVAGGGSDRVLTSVGYTLTAGAEVELFTTTNAAGVGAMNLIGNNFAQTIIGNAGTNIINGLGGADTMRGLAGNDTYYVDNAGDSILELVGGGSDRLLTSVSYTLTAGAEVELFTTANAAGVATINLVGSNFAQTIIGNAGTNIINGLGGADTMRGLAGNDTYYVDNTGDSILELAGGGSDRVLTSVSYTLTASAEVELFTTTNAVGVATINLVGNNFAQTIIGNAGANIINGLGGADTMQGLGGNDRYYVDNSADVVVEAAGGGAADRVLTSVDYSLKSGVEVEVLSTTNAAGTAALKLAGNSLANTVIGNAGNNFLNGAGGADTLTGLGGNDIFMFNTALGGGNIDAITDFSVADDTIRLDDAIFANIASTGVLTAAQFAANASGTAQDASDRIIYETDTGKLFYDENGSAAGGAVQFATLDAGLALTNADFFIV
jgi:serralysin